MLFVTLATALIFCVVMDRQNARHARQVADLCQRLQAPETAVAQHVVGQTTYEPQHLPFDDDGAYMKYVEDMTRPITSTDLA